VEFRGPVVVEAIIGGGPLLDGDAVGECGDGGGAQVFSQRHDRVGQQFLGLFRQVVAGCEA
jgi:hypothetical protein